MSQLVASSGGRSASGSDPYNACCEKRLDGEWIYSPGCHPHWLLPAL